MRKITFLILAVLLSVTANSQNLIDFWNGYSASTSSYATGEGSQGKFWGWSTNPATATTNWNVANGTSNIRYFDNASGYAPGRIMYMRWDGVVNTAGKYYLKLDTINVTQLTGGHSYTFTWSYCWNSNASAPTITTSICTARDGSGVVPALAATGVGVTNLGNTQTFVCNTTSKSMRTGTITFYAPQSGDYYISFGADKAALCAIRDLSLVDEGDKYTTLLELQTQTDALTLGDLSAVESDIALPLTAGTKGVTIKWASDKPAIIDSTGHVVQPAKYNRNVKLTATLSLPMGDTVFTSMKVFNATVIGVIPTPLEVATWDFKPGSISYVNDTLRVTDATSSFTGKVMNEARIRTIGLTDKINVLDLGNGKGYFDMGQDVGEAIYVLSNHTMMGYFRVDADYTNIAAGGNFYWNFSNSADIGAAKNGFIYGRLNNNMAAGISAYGSPSTPTATNMATPTGSWHHIAYTLVGTTGTVYIDGVQMAQNTSMLVPNLAVAKENMIGTICNWLGRSGWATDAYLQKTLLYDFRILSYPVTVDDLNYGYSGFDPVVATIDRLNNAYIEEDDYIAPELENEKNNLSLGDLSAVVADINLPVQGTLDPTIAISWKTTNSKLISTTGKVTRPDFFNYPDTLTAILVKNGQSVTKVFPATVLMKENTQFTGDLMMKFDFSNVQDSVVTDVAEKHFKGTLKNNAQVVTIGKTQQYKVLNLGDSIGYFDMGEDVGKVMYNLSDFTISAFFYIDPAYTDLNKAGNFLFTFSNSDNQLVDQNGYMFAALNSQSVSITPKTYTAASGNQSINYNTLAATGSWHNFTYTQKDLIGSLYIDGLVVSNGQITNLLKTTLPKNNLLGTAYNWIGRSCFKADSYLRKTKVHDIRVYNRALSDAEILFDVLGVANVVSALDLAMTEDNTGLQPIQNSGYSVLAGEGLLKINGLKGNEQVTISDITGRIVSSVNKSEIYVKSGVYIVRVNNLVAKVMVK